MILNTTSFFTLFFTRFSSLVQARLSKLNLQTLCRWSSIEVCLPRKWSFFHGIANSNQFQVVKEYSFSFGYLQIIIQPLFIIIVSMLESLYLFETLPNDPKSPLVHSNQIKILVIQQTLYYLLDFKTLFLVCFGNSLIQIAMN